MTKEELEGMITSSAAESKVLDFKQELYSEDKKKDFLIDVTAMANTMGGRIIIGVTEKRQGRSSTGVPETLTGVNCPNPSEVIGKWTNWLKDVNACDPPLNSIQFEVIDGFPEGPILTLEIPKSWLGPHRVSVNKQSFFYLRTSYGNQPMDTREIRASMLLADSLWDRMRRWRNERVSLLSVNQGQLMMASGTKAIVHLMPLESFTGELAIDINEPGLHRSLPFPFNGGQGPRNNFDGVISTVMPGDPVAHYSQLFRNGVFEGVLEIGNKDGSISGEYWEDKTCQYAFEALRFLRARIQGIVFVGLAVTECLDRRFILKRDWEAESCDRDVMILPEVEVTQNQVFEKVAQLRTLLGPAYDVAWQAVGLPGSPFDPARAQSR